MRRPPVRRAALAACRIWGLDLFFSGCSIKGRNTREDYLYLASNRFLMGSRLSRSTGGDGASSGCHFKKRGFDLEGTHMSDPTKIEKLFRVLTLAFLISYGWGCERKAGTCLSATQKRKSLFRLDRIAQIFADKDRFKDEIHELFDWSGRPGDDSIMSCNVNANTIQCLAYAHIMIGVMSVNLSSLSLRLWRMMGRIV